MAFDILRRWNDVHLQTIEYFLQVRYEGEAITETENELVAFLS